MSPFHGVLPAVITAIRDDTFDEPAFVALLEHLYRFPIDGLYVGGQTGEGLVLGMEARRRLTEAAIRHSPRGKAVIVHVGAMAVTDAIELARHAAECGAQAVSSLPPAGPYSFGEVRRYYEELAAASPLPLFVYHFTAYSPAVTSAQHLDELCSIGNVAGLKFTDYDLFTLAHLKERGAVVYYGRDEMLAEGLLAGADGAIGTFYNVVPGLATEIYRLARQGEWEQARPLQSRLRQLIRICAQVPMLSAVKTILGWQGVPCGPCLAPRLNLTAAQESWLREALESAGLDRDLQLAVLPHR
ncbi:MAG TPA: dihydrodipicolinate synthase family protein [Bryobacteraceae bacterium]|jgi:N-acetylneuraminate lyase|nr:dihydrodipicolinate synthase family protein [Bryobacteraceae bacterium]